MQKDLLSRYVGSKTQRHSSAHRKRSADTEGAPSHVGIKRAQAKSVRKHFEDVVLRNCIRKVTGRNTSVTKSSTPKEDQMIGDTSPQS